ncbi:MAG: hypothetical protein KF681_09545 [Bdellovibrionaceae bacterium]|nr:hypothetical protein [Pseudobdellovibrionaceae bacterium]
MKLKIVLLLALFAPLGALAQSSDIRAEDHFFYCSKELNSYFKHLFVVDIAPAQGDGKRDAEVAVSEGFRIGGTPLDFSNFETSQELAICSDRAASIFCRVGSDIEILIPRASIHEQNIAGHARLRSDKITINGDKGFCAIYDKADYQEYKERRERERNTNYGE